MTDPRPIWLDRSLAPDTWTQRFQKMKPRFALGMGVIWVSFSLFAQIPSNSVIQTPSTASDNAPPEPLSALPQAVTTDSSSSSNKRSGVATEPSTETSRAWQSLSKRQQQALAPLSDKWAGLTSQQKQKWLSLARGFYQLTDPEQMVLHGRMREWAALSPRERALARFNFNSTISLPIEDKRAQWAAYQKLTDDERTQLTAGLKAPFKSAARSSAAPNQRLVKAPAISADPSRLFQSIAPRQAVHPKTLLPHPPD